MNTRDAPGPGSRADRWSSAVDDLLASARERITRVAPEELAAEMERGALVVDIRPAAQREEEGMLPGALVVERNVLEWRLDPTSSARLPEVRDHSRFIVIVCSEGYASSIAAASIVDLGHESVGDLEGGYKAWAQLADRTTTT